MPASAATSACRAATSTRPRWAPKADTLIVMDAPPGKEDIAPYLKVTSLLEQAGAHVPHVHASDARRGFVAMEDLGNTQYLSLLKAGRGVDKLYGDALTTLANIQVRGLRAAQQLAPYDREPLERELNLMPEWFLAQASAASSSRPKSARCSPSPTSS